MSCKPMTAEFVFFCPEANGIDHELAEHEVVACRFVAAAAAVSHIAVGGVAEVVTGAKYVKVGAHSRTDVVVDNVHYDVDACLSVCLDNLLEFVYANIAVFGI